MELFILLNICLYELGFETSSDIIVFCIFSSWTKGTSPGAKVSRFRVASKKLEHDFLKDDPCINNTLKFEKEEKGLRLVL